MHFHGNACDIAQIAVCAQREAQAFRAHCLLVEYPGYGISDGYASEAVIDEVAQCVADFVLSSLGVRAQDLVLTGRSIGTGPACRLASVLQQRGQQIRALILQSPFASIRDTTGDLLGDSVSACLLNRWENWRYLVGSASSAAATSSSSSSSSPAAADPRVLTCPVLFIHADGDKIIPLRHSVYMHEYRLRRGLPSELFIQRSNERYLKGHNFFDYEKDVVLPAREFLLKYTPERGGNERLALRTEAVESIAVIPTAYRARHEAFKAQLERERNKESLLSRSAAKNNLERERDEREREAAALPSKWTPLMMLSLCYCPCVFCVEGNIACCFNAAQRCVSCVMSDEDEFDYVRLKRQEMEREKAKRREEAEAMQAAGEGERKQQVGEGSAFSSFFSLFHRQREIPVEHLLDERRTEVSNPIVAQQQQQQQHKEKEKEKERAAQRQRERGTESESMRRRQVSATLSDKDIESMNDNSDKERSGKMVYIPG